MSVLPMRTKISWMNIGNLQSVRDMQKYVLFMFPYIKRYWLYYAGQFGVMLFGVFYALYYAGLLNAITEAAVHHMTPRVGRLLLFGLGMFLANILLNFMNSYLFVSANVRIRKDVTEALFHRILHLPLASMHKLQSGDLTSRLKNDVDTAVGAVGSNLIQLVRLPLMGCAAFFYLWNMNRDLALTCLAFGPFALFAAVLFRPALRRNGQLIQSQFGQLFSYIGDSLAGYAVIRAFILERLFMGQYQRKNDKWVHLELQGARLRGCFRIGTQTVGAFAFLTNLGLGALFVAQGKLSVGALMASVSLLQHLLSPFTGVTRQVGGLQRALAASDRIREIYDQPTEERTLVPEPQQPSPTEEPIEIRMEEVCFTYDGQQDALTNVSLTIAPGQVVAFVGPSGAGKSTLFHLTLGFYRPSSGQIWLNDTPADAMDVTEIRDRIAYVPQDTYIFSGTIRENLLHGCPGASEEEMIDAARRANIHDFITGLPDGYDMEVGERGVRLSGGQRQRLAIARALLKDAPILLLDEATSALDTETEYLVQEALRRLMQNRTTMVIAHRLSTIRNSDFIVVMDKGRVLEVGNHQTLLREEGLYAHLYHFQFKDSDAVAFSS